MFRTLTNARGGGTALVSDPGYDKALQDNAGLKRKGDRQHSEIMGLQGDVSDALEMADRFATQAHQWKAHARYKEATLEAVIKMAQEEHAKSVANQKTADRLWRESASAPRPEERPFANNAPGVTAFRNQAYQEALKSETYVSTQLKKIKDDLRPKYKK